MSHPAWRHDYIAFCLWVLHDLQVYPHDRISIAGQYLSLDSDHNGMLSKQELLR